MSEEILNKGFQGRTDVFRKQAYTLELQFCNCVFRHFSGSVVIGLLLGSNECGKNQ